MLRTVYLFLPKLLSIIGIKYHQTWNKHNTLSKEIEGGLTDFVLALQILNVHDFIKVMLFSFQKNSVNE